MPASDTDLVPAARRAVERIAYSPTEAAEAIGSSRQFIYHLLATGELPSHKVRGLRRIAAADLRALVGAPMRQPSDPHDEGRPGKGGPVTTPTKVIGNQDTPPKPESAYMRWRRQRRAERLAAEAAEVAS